MVRRRWCAAGAAAALFLPWCRGGELGLFPYPVHERVLENGLRTIAIPMPSPGLVSYYTVVRTGSRDEYEPGHTGFAHFFEHMMFRGTKNFPGPVYDRAMTEMGADANAYTTDDYTCYHVTLVKEDLERVMELESDRFQNLDYAEGPFKTEAGAVHGEFLKGLSSPWFHLEEKLLGTAFKEHTYRHTTIGFKADIEAMPSMYEYSLGFYRRYYRPENVILLVVGDIDPAAVLKAAEPRYGGWARGYRPPEVPVEPEQTAERRAEVSFPGQTLPILLVAYKTPAFDAGRVDVAALGLLANLAFGETSDLYKKLVLNEQRVQFLYADPGMHRDPHLLTVATMVKEENDVAAVEAELATTVAAFQRDDVPAARLAAEKSRQKYSFLMGLDTSDRTAGHLAPFLAASGGIASVNRLYAMIEAVTPADIRAAAQKHLTPERRTVVVVKGAR